MKKHLKVVIVAVLAFVLTVLSIAGISSLGSNTAKAESVTIHFKWSGDNPHLYFENVNGAQDTPISYPGIPMEDEQNGWYSYTIENAKSASVQISVPNVSFQTTICERESGEWWFDQGTWFAENPDADTQDAKEEQGKDASMVVKQNNMTQLDAVQVNAGETSIKVHCYSTDGVPKVYYWNAFPDQEVAWPGVTMEQETGKEGWYTYSFPSTTKINVLFNIGNVQTDDFKATSGEWWFDGTKWSNIDPTSGGNTPKPTESAGPIITPIPSVSNDFRSETIYFVITTRFFDGDKNNNVHCTDDKVAGNGDDDPAWRGDFKGLIEKLDYIKALGFSAIWMTPVVENASSYDFHGYHAINFKKVDPRYESNEVTYQTLINECHKRGMKVIQDIVLNHTSNNGEEGLFPIMKQEYSLGKGAAGNSTTMVKNDVNNVLDAAIKIITGNEAATYDTTTNPTHLYQARDYAMKSGDLVYRKKVDINYEGPTVTTGQFAGDCMELNTEYPGVFNYLVDAYNGYIDMGVDAFRIDTVKHISRLTFNNVFLPAFLNKASANGNDNFYMFGEVAKRVYEFWNKNNPNVSPPFYTWKEEKTYAWNANSTDGKDNLASCMALYDDNENKVDAQRKSQNAYLNGNNYHAPDHSQYSGMGVIDYAMHFSFETAQGAFNVTKDNDQAYSDATYNVTYVDSHDYGPAINGRNEQDGNDLWRYDGGTEAWAENLNLLFTFRGIPCLYYGSEIEFQAGLRIDRGNTMPLAQTGRAYFGDNIEGSVTTTDFGVYSGATGAMATTLNKPLAKHIQRLNLIRRAVPALQKGQYSTENVNGSIAYKRRFTDSNTDSFACITVTDGATFSGLPGGTYTDVVSGDTKTVAEGGTLTITAPGKGNMRVYVLDTAKTKAPGKVGEAGQYLK